MVNLSKSIFKHIRNHAKSEFPNECCGFVIKRDDKLECIRCNNIAEDKLHNFSISPVEYVKAIESGEIVYVYHSHPDVSDECDFSPLDKMNSVGHNIPYILYHLHKNRFVIFNEKELNIKYIGYPFEDNKHDCLSLVEEFYLNEFNIKLPRIERDAETLKKNPNLMIEKINYYNLKEIEDGSLNYGDILLANEGFGPTHLMIYIGRNQILHQTRSSYSIIEIYSNFYKDNTLKVLRHKDLC